MLKEPLCGVLRLGHYSFWDSYKVRISLKRKLTWKWEAMKVCCENVVIAGQTTSCNDPQPRSRILGTVSITFSDGREKMMELGLPKRQPCGRACWEMQCEQCKALRKRK